jgi:outer membrane biosynthesis protein TonB
MAKKKSAAPAKETKAAAKPAPAKSAAPKPAVAKTASPAKAAAPKAAAPKKSASNGDASTAADALGHEQIGFVAGDVWVYLTDNGQTSLATLKKEVNTTPELLCAAVGWLAREDKLDFEISGKTVKVALK